MKILVTGGLGTGKTTIINTISEERDVVFTNTDTLLHQAYKDPHIISKITAIYGDEFVETGVINRKLLAKRVKEMGHDFTLLEQVTMGYVQAHLNQFLHDNEGRNILVELPVLWEMEKKYQTTGFSTKFDLILCLYCPVFMQALRGHDRIVKDGSIDPRVRIYVMDIIRKQLSTNEKIALTEQVGGIAIDTAKSLDELKREIEELCDQLGMQKKS